MAIMAEDQYGISLCIETTIYFNFFVMFYHLSRTDSYRNSHNTMMHLVGRPATRRACICVVLDLATLSRYGVLTDVLRPTFSYCTIRAGHPHVSLDNNYLQGLSRHRCNELILSTDHF
ncbi:uncharacterized protein LAESUDRAFT_331171 [Laetiporus sulphureus 93-53]|uniref:Uncharacterized protein n=1 Tax=Laetiporus sulphureus 93-53 TaxID=1314785 RepID=A0A165CXG9_9APHY|nr:uncharacterized protein LAESUDRAFT_331171 [Laetiporus sulphureus 93-53]KZT03670.1 hypothetical protein LAESUDRAFT_331171 [Laetiporus sulphureus 93-53]